MKFCTSRCAPGSVGQAPSRWLVAGTAILLAATALSVVVGARRWPEVREEPPRAQEAPAPRDLPVPEAQLALREVSQETAAGEPRAGSEELEPVPESSRKQAPADLERDVIDIVLSFQDVFRVNDELPPLNQGPGYVAPAPPEVGVQTFPDGLNQGVAYVDLREREAVDAKFRKLEKDYSLLATEKSGLNSPADLSERNDDLNRQLTEEAALRRGGRQGRDD